MNKKPLSVWIPLIVALAFIAGIGAGLFVYHTSTRSNGEKKLSNIFNLIEKEYVEKVDIDSIVEKTLPSLLNNLDPHSVYIPAASLEAVNEDLEGAFSGIGIRFMLENDSIVVVEVISGGPSEKVGIMPGDRIVEIDGKPFTGSSITNEKVMSTLRGAKDTQVKLGIKRNTSKKILDYDVTRGDIPVTSIDAAYMIDDTVGYVKVNKFGRSTFDEFFQSMMNLKNQGAQDYIVDLRGNGGGFMEMAVLMCNEFLPRNSMIVYTQGRDGRNRQVIKADGKGSFQNDGLTVLIDEFSASASEIFAGAMQDNDRGVIIGRRSFGKGLIQTQTTLPDSSAIRLTIARYYTPSGRCIQKDYSDSESYNKEVLERYNSGEIFSADSMKIDHSAKFKTAGGRTVYGGGGIVPDTFVPNDTTGISNYYIKVFNAGLIQKWAFRYCDSHREKLSKCKNIDELLAALPGDFDILTDFATFASQNGVAKQWKYIERSRDLIVNQLKACVARDILGIPGYYMIANRLDNTVNTAYEALLDGCKALNIDTSIAEEE